MPDTPARTALRWSHAGLNCRDLDATEAFYRTWFGFERARAVELGEDRIVFLRNGDAYLELFTSHADPGPAAGGDGPQQPGSIRHLAFQTDDLQAFLDRAGEAVPISLGPLEFDEFIPGWRTVWVTDPDGVVVEVSQGYRDEQPVHPPHGH
ncbi:VOC family protein [Streptomyces sp. NPDC006393]|uniref:VOC family protein n=1 Tax=Streptomyces sp. NPDC006393 TaxID=3156763 RepID=UPI0033CFF3E5